MTLRVVDAHRAALAQSGRLGKEAPINLTGAREVLRVFGERGADVAVVRSP